MAALNKRVRLAGVLGPAGSLFKRSFTLREAFLPATKVIARQPGGVVGFKFESRDSDERY